MIFKDNLFKAQEQFLPKCKRSKHGIRAAQKKKAFLTELNSKIKYLEMESSDGSQQEHRDVQF